MAKIVYLQDVRNQRSVNTALKSCIKEQRGVSLISIKYTFTFGK